MLGDVVEAALLVGRVLVVTDDPAVVPAAAELVRDPGEGMGAAVAADLDLVERNVAHPRQRLGRELRFGDGVVLELEVGIELHELRPVGTRACAHRLLSSR